MEQFFSQAIDANSGKNAVVHKFLATLFCSYCDGLLSDNRRDTLPA